VSEDEDLISKAKIHSSVEEGTSADVGEPAGFKVSNKRSTLFDCKAGVENEDDDSDKKVLLVGEGCGDRIGEAEGEMEVEEARGEALGGEREEGDNEEEAEEGLGVEEEAEGEVEAEGGEANAREADRKKAAFSGWRMSKRFRRSKASLTSAISAARNTRNSTARTEGWTMSLTRWLLKDEAQATDNVGARAGTTEAAVDDEEDDDDDEEEEEEEEGSDSRALFEAEAEDAAKRLARLVANISKCANEQTSTSLDAERQKVFGSTNASNNSSNSVSIK